VVDRRRDVVEGHGPAAVLPASQPPVLDVPHREAAADEVGRDRRMISLP
jgi:hypothetical protein